MPVILFTTISIFVKILLSTLLILISWPVQAWESWTTEQRQWYVASNAVIIADWATTRNLSRRYEEGYHERNALMGRQPHQDRVDLHFVSVLIGHYFLTDYFQGKDRTIYLQIFTTMSGVTVAGNISIGLKLKF